MSPEIIHTRRHIATDPEYRSADVDDTNIPDPIMVPIIRLVAEKRPSSLFSLTSSMLMYLSKIPTMCRGPVVVYIKKTEQFV